MAVKLGLGFLRINLTVSVIDNQLNIKDNIVNLEKNAMFLLADKLDNPAIYVLPKIYINNISTLYDVGAIFTGFSIGFYVVAKIADKIFE